MARIIGPINQYPARMSFVWYAVVIALGTIVLTRPFCHAEGRPPFSPIDALFTATSATCVTGLTVRSTGGDLSLAGQMVVLLLIQIGGIGIMTVTTFATFRFGARAGLRHRALVNETLGLGEEADLLSVLRQVIALTALCEGVGFVLLAARNLVHEPPGTALWHALFHSISAYCNAGFALYDDSLTRYQGDVVVNMVVPTLIIIGGIGYPVVLDLRRNWRGPWNERWDRLTLHSKIMLIGTTALLALGAGGFLALEWDGILSDMPLGRKLMVAWFYSVSVRTAGFNTVELATLTNATLFCTVILMAVGAGPCSAAGGFKVSTLMTLLLRAWNTFRGNTRVNLFRRTIPTNVIDRATATALLFSVVAIVALTSLLMIEQSGVPHSKSHGLFLDASFEVVSALGTVGLSTGMTSHLTYAGQAVVIVLMFIGRLGPISVSVALSRGVQKRPVEYPTEEPLIG